jgi:hypothetical protein
MANLLGTSFKKADQLWKNVRDNMTKFINDNGGQAGRGATQRVSPNWFAVERYLKGLITFAQLKADMGC